MGLMAAYIQDASVKQLIKQLMALGSIPIPFVRICYFNLRNYPQTNQLIQLHPLLQN